jgi:hypothetical protein
MYLISGLWVTPCYLYPVEITFFDLADCNKNRGMRY